MNALNEHRRYHLAVWIVIASEALLFAGLFALYWSYRAEFPAQFDAGITHDVQWMGGLNTFLLLTSSFAIAWSILMTRQGRRGAATISLVVTLVLGAAFLFFKFWEWKMHGDEGLVPGSSLFFTLYFLMTGLHALHVIAGMSLVTWVTVRAERGLALELVALYWHFVDVIWVFLWPMFYLAKP
ncbi:MAG TPA: cytochrome c oxidase subunit 3 [Kofleriaceae bacterium]|nr:cytochrome c oxidase subunit 3 [Kofleriaceae bacterium]